MHLDPFNVFSVFKMQNENLKALRTEMTFAKALLMSTQEEEYVQQHI